MEIEKQPVSAEGGSASGGKIKSIGEAVKEITAASKDEKNGFSACLDFFVNRMEVLKSLPEKEFRPEYEKLSHKFAKAFFEEFPESREEIKFFLGIPDFLWKCGHINDIQESEAEKKIFDPNLIRDLAEYQFLFTDFMAGKKDDPEYLRKVWQFFDKMAEITHTREILEPFKTGLRGQLATEHLFRSSDISALTATPREDSYHKIDLWIKNPDIFKAIQTKTSPDIKELQIFGNQEEIVFPAVSIEEKDGEAAKDVYFFDNFWRNANVFWTRTGKYSEEIGKPIEAFMVLMPAGEINPVTGEPSEKLQEQFKEKIKKIIHD